MRSTQWRLVYNCVAAIPPCAAFAAPKSSLSEVVALAQQQNSIL